MVLGSNPLIQVTPGLMIWTIVCFLVTLFVLKRVAFGPIQKMIDERRERILRSLQEADEARDEARRLLEEHRSLIGQARGDAGTAFYGRHCKQRLSVPARSPSRCRWLTGLRR